MQPSLLDHGPDRRAGVAQSHGPAVGAKPTGEKREVEHQRGVAEHELAEIDHHVATGLDGSGESPAAVPLGRPILISSTTQDSGVGIELDDPSNLQKPAGRRKGNGHYVKPKA